MPEVEAECGYIDRRIGLWQRTPMRAARIRFDELGISFERRNPPFHRHWSVYRFAWSDVARIRFTSGLRGNWDSLGLLPPNPAPLCAIQAEIAGAGRLHSWHVLPRFVLPWPTPRLAEGMRLFDVVPESVDHYWCSEAATDGFSLHPPEVLLYDW